MTDRPAPSTTPTPTPGIARRRARRRTATVALFAALGMTAYGGAIALGGAALRGRQVVDEQQRSPVQRGPRLSRSIALPQEAGAPPLEPAIYPEEFRSIDGSGNAPDFLTGAAGTPMSRRMPAAYADGVGEPAGADRPSARAVSTMVMAQDGVHDDPIGSSDYIWQWGQWLDHDVVETPLASPAEPFDVPVPTGDPWFDPFSTGESVIPLARSAGVFVDGVRQQLNNITAWIDGSQVYGSEDERAHALRTNDGTGRLATSAGDLLPFNVDGLDNAPVSDDPSFFVGGDIRVNEQVALTAMHTLFVREHNHWAGVIAAEEPGLDGDAIYERARAIVGAELQAITFNEYLPRLLGPGAIPPYAGWQPDDAGGIDNEFATAAFRVGHTMLSPRILRVDASGRAAPEGHLDLSSAFFTPAQVIDHGIDSILRGLVHQRAQAVDADVVDAVRNFLFGPPGSGGLDLVSLNIQRGRDHGIPSYNQLRASVGRPPATHFGDITPDATVAGQLAAVYAHVDDVDAWVGLLCEPRHGDALVGETLAALLGDQFVRLRDGDRFWYQSYLPAELVELVEQQTLATIIRRNTAIGAELPDDVFAAVLPTCAADVTGDGVVGLDDVLAMFAAWGPCAGACPEDVDGDGAVGVPDLIQVLARWGDC